MGAFQRALALAEQPQDQIEAALGLADGPHYLDRLDEEERPDRGHAAHRPAMQAHAALARLNHLHGNIYFPRGDCAECRRLHEEALSCARIGRDLETEAKALSGIGDATITHKGACRPPTRCSINAYACANAMGWRTWRRARSAPWIGAAVPGAEGQALRDAMEAVECGARLGNHRAQVFSRLTAAAVLVAGGQDALAELELTCALALARNLGASRFEAILLEGLARVALRQGERGLAQTLIMEAASLVERFELQRYIGPWVYGSLGDDQRRWAARASRPWRRAKPSSPWPAWPTTLCAFAWPPLKPACWRAIPNRRSGTGNRWPHCPSRRHAPGSPTSCG